VYSLAAVGWSGTSIPRRGPEEVPDVRRTVSTALIAGASGANGPVVVPLDPKTINGANAGVSATAALAKQIAANPAGFYVNIHTPAAPGGALRGQLASTPSGAIAGSGGLAGTSSDTNVALIALMVAGAGLVGGAGWVLVRR